MTPLEVLSDWIITNPPYRQAEQFVRHGMLHAERTAWLLRLNFLGSQKRVPLHARFDPDVHVLSKRPSFTYDGRTDATEYAWFVYPGSGRLSVIDCTPYFMPPDKPQVI